MYWSVHGVYRSVLSAAVTPHFPHEATYAGTGGKAWCVGIESRAPSIAEFFCGEGVSASHVGRIFRRRVPGRVTSVAGAGELPIVRILDPDRWPADLLARGVVVPREVSIHTDLPADVEALHAQLLTSATRGDFRRIRHANFSFRVTADPDLVREFYVRHHTPLLMRRFPEDGTAAPVEDMVDKLTHGGELICADLDGTWVAGVFNVANESTYDVGTLGIRDGDETVRHNGVVAALIVRSLERAVELGRSRATLGGSLPFLGKGSIWFKVKWGGVITWDSAIPDMRMFMDLRNAAVRSMLSATPVIHAVGGGLVVSTWLRRGDKPVEDTVRGVGRFPGISRWYVFGEPQTLDAAAPQLSANKRIVPLPVSLHSDGPPLWLGEMLPR